MESSHYVDLILSSRVSLSYIAPSNVFTPTKALNAELRAATWRCSPLVITKTGNAYRYFRVIWMLVYFHLYRTQQDHCHSDSWIFSAAISALLPYLV